MVCRMQTDNVYTNEAHSRNVYGGVVPQGYIVFLGQPLKYNQSTLDLKNIQIATDGYVCSIADRATVDL